MATSIALEQRESYSEVLEVLRHMETKYVNMIPKKVIMFFYDNCSLEYEFKMDKPLGETELKENTLNLLALLDANYWSKTMTKDELITKYAELTDVNIQKKLNAQLEKENAFTKIDVDKNDLPTVSQKIGDKFKRVLVAIKEIIVKIFGNW